MKSSGVRSRKFAFVLPRYGAGIAGGAETLAGELAKHLAARGDQVEIFTTCARDNRTWEDYFPAGTIVEDGVIIHRFPVDSRDLEVWVPLQIAIAQGLQLSIADQCTWLEQGVNSRAMYLRLVEAAEQFEAVFFAPYLFPTTYFGSLLLSGKAVLIPCLHDEHYAYLESIEYMFNEARGCLFNAEPEQELAEGLYGSIKGGEVGMGFEVFSQEYINSIPPYFRGEFKYLLYLGRKETGKNAHILIDQFIAAKERALIPTDLKLVIAGGGSFEDLHRPQALKRDDIVDITHCSEEDKRKLLRHALMLVQPSQNESFSIVLMEAWRLNVPVLVHGGCAVTRHHVVRSGGGLYFVDLLDFSGAVREVMEQPVLREELANHGMRYVSEYYNWEAVLKRFDLVVSRIFGEEVRLGVSERAV